MKLCPKALAVAGRVLATAPEWWAPMIDFLTAVTFSSKDLIQFFGMAFTIASGVWFLARRIGQIDKRIALMEARQTTHQEDIVAVQATLKESQGYQAEVLREVFALRERVTRLEVRGEVLDTGEHRNPIYPPPPIPEGGPKP